ncbi:MAG: hypothetical protein ACK415_00795 [Thermodesulfovibrionales bacterium]
MPPLLLNILMLCRNASGPFIPDLEDRYCTKKYEDCSVVSFVDKERMYDMEILITAN